jgi:hypothetical protein
MIRFRMAWLAGLMLSGLMTPLAASADANAPALSLHGVSFKLPAGLAREAAPLPSGVSHVFSDGQTLPLRVIVEQSPANASPQGIYGAAFSMQNYAEGFAKGLRGKLKGLEVSALAPVAHDAERGAARLRFETKGPAPVLAMLALPDTDEAWRPLRASGADLNEVRCLIETLLGGRPSATPAQLQASYTSAAQRCNRSEAQVTAFVQQSGPALFGASVARFEAITYFTRHATLTVFVTASAARGADTVSAADAIWTSASIAAEARPDVSIFDVARGAPAFEAGQLLGAMIGAAVRMLLLGGILGFLLGRFARLAPAKAVSFALVGLGLFLAVGAALSGGLSLSTGLQLATYVVVGAYIYRPMTRWVAARLSHAATHAPTRASTHER